LYVLIVLKEVLGMQSFTMKNQVSCNRHDVICKVRYKIVINKVSLVLRIFWK